MTFDKAKKQIKKIYETLSLIPAVSGTELRYADSIKNAVMSFTDFFTECTVYGGGLLFYHRCGKENAKKLLIDAHFDSVGFVVTELLGGGFVRVSNIGGIDARLLFASEIEIYGKKTVKGVFSSTPVHLRKLSDKDEKKTEVSDICVDTGYPDEKLKELVSVGDFCGFVQNIRSMQGDILCGRSMDNRICASAAIFAAQLMESENIGCDIIFSLSAGEETGSGPTGYLASLSADGALVLDVNFGREKGVPEYFSYELGAGCGVSYSGVTNRSFTDALVGCAKSGDIPLSTMVEWADTGTNANKLANACLGTPCAVLSVPEKYMHQSCECVSVSDVYSMSCLICAFAREFENVSDRLVRERCVKRPEGDM